MPTFPTHINDWNDAIALLALTHRRIARTKKVTDFAQLVYVKLRLTLAICVYL